MSPPAICCGTRPSFCKVLPAQPPMRILRPEKSEGSLISLLNQPPICAPVLPITRLYVLNFLPKSSSSFWPSPSRYHAFCWRVLRPNGVGGKKAHVGAVPVEVDRKR